jgi:hypothetical protein
MTLLPSNIFCVVFISQRGTRTVFWLVHPKPLPTPGGRGPTSPGACLDPQTPRLGAGARHAVWHLEEPTGRSCRPRGSPQDSIVNACIQTTFVRMHGKKCCLFRYSNVRMPCGVCGKVIRLISRQVTHLLLHGPKLKLGVKAWNAMRYRCCLLWKKSYQPVILQLRSHIAS